MNIQNQIHEKTYIIRIYNTTDNFDNGLGGTKIGSGVENLYVYAQATPTLDDTKNNFVSPNFTLSTMIGRVSSVDSRPSYAVSGRPDADKLVLRDAAGIPLDHELFNGKVQHGPYNLYPFEFNTYINGNYYYIWVLAEDKAGNLELINSDDDTFGKNTKNIPLITTALLTDTTAPEFNGTEYVGETAVLSAGRYTINLPNYINISNFEAWFNNRNILAFTDDNVIHYRYIIDAAYSSGNLSFILNEQSDLSSTITDLYIVPETIATAGIGTITLDIPESDSVNLAGYLIELISEASPILLTDDGNVSYEYISGLTYNNKYIDTGIIFDRDDFLGSGQKFLYKITPISKFTSDGLVLNSTYSNAIKGMPSFSYSTDLEDQYFPSSGFIPSALILKRSDDTSTDWFDNSSNDGSIILKWCKNTGVEADGLQDEDTLDANNDLRGYIIQRMKRRSVAGGAWEESNWEDLIYTDKEDFVSTTNFDRSYIDSGLDSYNVNKEPDTLSPNYVLVNYKYRIAAFDYGGNQSVWSYWNNGDPINASDTTPPEISNYSLECTGKIGGWHLEFLDTANSTTEIDVKRQRTDADGLDLSGYGEVFIGNRMLISPDGSASFSDMSAPDSEVQYAKFAVRGRDKNGNWTTWSSWTSRFGSKTPNMAMDNWEPKEPTNVVATFTEIDGKVNISWTKPTEEQMLHPTAIASMTNANLTINTATNIGQDNEFVVAGSFVRVIETSVTGSIESNLVNSVTVSSWSGVAPTSSNTFEIVNTLSDGDGFIIFKRLIDEPNNWILVHDTDSWGTTSYDDFALLTGEWYYGVAAYDLSGNESSIAEASLSVDIADTTPPVAPALRNTIGDTGLIVLQWDQTANDIDEYNIYIKDKTGKYVLDINGEFISDPTSRTTTPTFASSLINTLSVYDVTDTLEDVKLWEVGIVAIDTFNNESALEYTTVINVWGKYEPAAQEEPPVLLLSSLTADITNKDGSIEFAFANTNILIGGIYIERKSKIRDGSYGSYSYVDTEIFSSSDDYTSMKFRHTNLGNRTYKYRFRSISKFGNIGELISAIETADLEVVDYAGPGNINSMASFRDNCWAYPEAGFINIKFDDVFDNKLVKYEIWRTPYRYITGSTPWDINNFFSSIVGGYKTINTKWERITTIYSTLSNVTDQDNFRYQDNDWTMDGLIPYSTGSDSKTRIDIGYNGYATYAIVPMDEYDNRSNPYFVGATKSLGMISPAYEQASSNAWIAIASAKDYMVSAILSTVGDIREIIYGLDGVRKSPTADIVFNASLNWIQYIPDLYIVWVQKDDDGSNTLIKSGAVLGYPANLTHTMAITDFDSSSILIGKTISVYIYKNSSEYLGLASIETNKLAKSSLFIKKNSEISTYWIITTPEVVQRNEDNITFTPTKILADAKYKLNSASIGNYSGRFLLESSPDGSTWTPRYTSSANETSLNGGSGYTINTLDNAATTMFRISLYAAGGTSVLLDREIIPVNKVGQYLLDLNNDNHTLTSNTDGSIPTGGYVGASCTAKVYFGATDDSANWTITSTPSAGLTPSTDQGATYTLTNIANATDSGTVTFSASRSGGYATLSKIFTISKSKQGSTGATGAGMVYRGIYSSSSVAYYSTSTRKDIVKFPTNTTNPYWMAKSSFTSSVSPDTSPPSSGSVGNTYWDPFGATFSSVATGILLSEESVVAHRMTFGSTDGDGIIQSAGVTGLYTGANGIYLYAKGDGTVQHFRIGTVATSALVKGIAWNNTDLIIKGNILLGTTGYATGDGIFLGEDSSAWKLRVGIYNKQRLDWDGATLKIYNKDNVAIFSSDATNAASLAGWNVDSTKIYKDNASLSSTGYISFGTTPPTAFDQEGIYLGYTAGAAKLSLYKDIDNYFEWDGASLDIAAQNIEARGQVSIIDNAANKVVIDGDYIHFQAYNAGWNNGLKIQSISSSSYDAIHFNYVDTNTNVVSIWNAGGGEDGYTFKVLDGETSYFGDSITVSGNILPGVNDTYNLGSSSAWWSNGYVSTLRAAILAKSEITVFGGWQLITKDAGKIPVNVLAIANLLDFGKTMTTGDIVYFRKSGQVEYMQVGSLYSGTTYYITRAYQGFGTASAWSKGDTFAVLGEASKARIELYAETDTRISLWQLGTSGSELSAQKEIVRIGNLKDSFGYGSGDIYGFALGDVAGNKFITYDPTNGLIIRGNITADSGTFTGTVNATAGKFGTATNYWSVGATGLTAVSTNTDVVIKYGKADFGADTTSGFILGYDYSATKSKFEIGATATGILKYADGSLSMTGGTITSGLFQTTDINTLTSATIVIDGANNELSFRKANRTLAEDKVLTITSNVYSTGISGIMLNNGIAIFVGPDISYGGYTNNSLVSIRPEQLRVINFDTQLALQIQTSVVGNASGITVETNSTSAASSTSKAIYAKAIGGITANYGIHTEAISATPINFGIYATALNATSVNYGVVGYSTVADNNFAIFSNGNLGVGNGSLGVGSSGTTMSSSKFLVDNNGNITKINNVAVSFPTSNTAGVLTNNGSGTLTWAASGGTGTVTSVSVVSANGFAGSVATSTTTPAITISTSITGLLKGNGTAISAASSGTDYALPSQTFYIGTTQVAINRTSAALSLTGVSIDGSAGTATSATSATTATNLAGGLAYYIPYQTSVNTTAFLAPSGTSSVITYTSGGGLGWLTYTNANTASTIVWRDASGNFTAGTITAALNGNASTVTNGIYSSSSYANPSWITSLAESKISFTDITTGNASISSHGFLPKLNNSATQFLNGQGAWATPSATVDVAATYAWTNKHTWVKTGVSVSTNLIDVSLSSSSGADLDLIAGKFVASRTSPDTTDIFGIYATASGGTNTYAAYFDATGGYAGYFNNGLVYIKDNLQVGTAKFIVSTTGQLTKINDLLASSHTNKVVMSDGTSYTPTDLFARTNTWTGANTFSEQVILTRASGSPANTIDASGSSYIQSSYYTSFNLDNFSNGTTGQILIFENSGSQNIVVRDVTVGGGNIRLAGAVSYTMGQYDTLMLIYNGTYWLETSRSNN